MVPGRLIATASCGLGCGAAKIGKFDCLPVIVKLFGGSTHYEQMVEARLRGAQEMFFDATETAKAQHRAAMEVQRREADSAARLDRTG